MLDLVVTVGSKNILEGELAVYTWELDMRFMRKLRIKDDSYISYLRN